MNGSNRRKITVIGIILVAIAVLIYVVFSVLPKRQPALPTDMPPLPTLPSNPPSDDDMLPPPPPQLPM